MALELTVTAKGQVTLRRAVLDHLGITPGAKVSVLVVGERTDRAGRRRGPRRHQKPARRTPAIGAAAGVARGNAGSDRSGRRLVRIAVDANVLVRYLTWDDEGQ